MRLTPTSRAIIPTHHAPFPIRNLSTNHRTRRDLRICFIGDSFVAGTGDDQFRGWPSDLCTAARHAYPVDITLYNLGIRRNTSADIAQRWKDEVQARLSGFERNCGRLVFAFGTNDCVMEGARVRVEREDTLRNAERILREAKELCPTLMVGPPPSTTFGDEGLNDRVMDLEGKLEQLCTRIEVPFLPITSVLRERKDWCSEAVNGDGIHPNTGGYRLLAAHVLEWNKWQKMME